MTVFILGIFFTAKLSVVYLFQDHITVWHSDYKTDRNHVNLQPLPLLLCTVHVKLHPLVL